jgi:LysM repeat protein
VKRWRRRAGPPDRSTNGRGGPEILVGVTRRSTWATLTIAGLLSGPVAACASGNGGALPAPSPKLTVLPEANAAPPVGIVTTTATTLPPTTTSLPGSQTYTIATGDTLTRIATRYGTTVATLLALNRFEDPNNIAIGQRIVVPAPASTTTAVATTAPAEPTTGTTGAGADADAGDGAGETPTEPTEPTEPTMGPLGTTEPSSTASTLPAATETG